MSGSEETVKPIKGSGDEPWDRNRYRNTDASNVRLPKIANNRQNTSGNVEKSGNPPETVLKSSKLNADAAEFVPQGMTQWAQPQGPVVPPVIAPEDFSYLTEAIEVLTLSPGRYQEFLPPISDIAESVMYNKAGLDEVFDIIIEQCIAEPNFRYTGARMCRDLCIKFGLAFINCLLNRCSVRFDRLPELQQSRVCGFGMTLAELFLQITLDGNSHIAIFASGLQNVLNMLSVSQDTEAIRTVCQILKLCGVALEREGISLQTFFSRLEQHLREVVDRNARCMIENLLLLRRTEWEHMPSGLPEGPAIIPTTHDPYGNNEPVFYSPDGQIMSEEERSFLLDNIPASDDIDDYIMENGMDDEAAEAYEEFLRSSQNNHNNYRPS